MRAGAREGRGYQRAECESDEKRQASNPKSTANTDIVGGRFEWPSVGPKSTIVRLHWPQDCGSCAV